VQPRQLQVIELSWKVELLVVLASILADSNKMVSMLFIAKPSCGWISGNRPAARGGDAAVTPGIAQACELLVVNARKRL
jgi:hypothetical protein